MVSRHYIRMPTNLMMVVCKIQVKVYVEKTQPNKPGTRGQALNGILEYYADRSVSDSVSRPRLDV